MRTIASWVTLTLSLLCLSTRLLAAPGEPDATFGTNGVQLLDFGGAANVTIVASAKQSYGKIVVVGYVQSGSAGLRKAAVGRLNEDGTPDTSFGTNGWSVVTDMSYSGQSTIPSAIAVDPYDSIVIVGQFGPNVFLARFTPMGLADRNFGYGGMVVDSQSFAETPQALAVTGFGEIVVAGYYTDIQARTAYTTRYMNMGAREGYFGENGRIRYALGAGNNEARSILASPYGGGFLLAGYAEDAGGNRDFAVAKVDGGSFALDPSFGTNGVKTIDFGGQDDAFAMAYDNSGSLIVAGRSASGATASFAWVRLNANNGDLDPGPGVGGKVTTPVPWQSNPSGYATAMSVAVTPYDRIVLFGTVKPDPYGQFPNQSDMAVAQYFSWGQLVPFGWNWVAITPGSPDDGDSAVGGAFTRSGYTLVLGSRFFAGSESLVVARLDYAGFPDMSFGNGGVERVFAYAGSDDYIQSLARTPDGGFVGIVLAAPAQWLFRIHADGSWDPTFGWSSLVPLDTGGGTVFTQPDGKILIAHAVDMPFGANTTYGAAAVTRLNADGSRDNGFNGNGRVVIDFNPGTGSGAQQIALMPDGRIVVAAQMTLSTPSGYRQRMALARLNADGSPDSGFGNGGRFVIDRPGAGDESVTGLGLLADGRIVVGGGGDGGGFVVYRVMPWGALDSGWAGGGAALANCWPQILGRLAVASDGKVVVAGQSPGVPVDSCFARFLDSGTLDPTFGIGGTIIHELTPHYERATSVAIQPDGRIVAGVVSEDGSVAVARLNADGTLDTSFNGWGMARVEDGNVGADAMLLQPDGNIVIWSSSRILGDMDVVIARFQGGGSAAPIDTTPDPFTFNAISGASTGTLYFSNPVTITGINAPAAVTVFQGAGYSIGCTGTFTFMPGTISQGQTLCAANFSAGSGGMSIDTVITVGGVSGTFTVTTGAVPDTAITSSPPPVTAAATALFTFNSPDGGTAFQCSLDSGPYVPCTSPATYSGLVDGNHYFSVASVGVAGADPTPAAFAWRIDTTPPETIFLAGPSGITTQTSAAFTFTAPSDPDGPVTFECRINGAPFAPCTSPANYTGLADGTLTFEVRAVDFLGNADATPASRTWTIDSTAPDTIFVSGPPAVGNSNTATFVFTSNEPNVTFECRDATASPDSWVIPCVSPLTLSPFPDGTFTLIIRARDAAGNVDATPASWTFTVDTSTPDTTIGSGPSAQTSSQAPTFTFSSNEAGATFACSLDGGAFVSCASPAGYTALAEGAHTFEVRASDAAGNVDATPARHTWIIDLTAPDTLITSGPAAHSSSTTATFVFQATEPGATFQCAFNGAAYVSCSSPQTYAALADGIYRLLVRAIDGAGNTGSPSVFDWEVDTVSPDTMITGGPAGTIAQTTATFTFQTSEPFGTFECKLDAAAFAPCSSPASYSGLAEGSHQFQVRATDRSGNVDPSPAVAAWTVDITAPDTTITSGPSGTVASTAATILFSASEGGATFECRIDGAAFAACASPMLYSSLGQGSHTFDVRAKDAAGNADATPASRTWSVDTAAPDTTITAGPTGAVASTSATFQFSASEGGSTFECRIDGAVFAACTSPKSYSALAQGSHTFDVRAKDALGNTDATAASRTWTVDTVAPGTTITSGPPSSTTSTTATFTFTSSEGGSTFECQLDGAGFAACATPKTYTGLSKTIHTFQVRARDAAGNADASPASLTWRVK